MRRRVRLLMICDAFELFVCVCCLFTCGGVPTYQRACSLVCKDEDITQRVLLLRTSGRSDSKIFPKKAASHHVQQSALVCSLRMRCAFIIHSLPSSWRDSSSRSFLGHVGICKRCLNVRGTFAVGRSVSQCPYAVADLCHIYMSASCVGGLQTAFQRAPQKRLQRRASQRMRTRCWRRRSKEAQRAVQRRRRGAPRGAKMGKGGGRCISYII